MEKICVAVRLRPLVSEDSSSAAGTFWKVEDNRISLHKIHGTPLSASSHAFGTSLSSSISFTSPFCFQIYSPIFHSSLFQITYSTKEAPMLTFTSSSPRTSSTPRSMASTVSKFDSRSFLAFTVHCYFYYFSYDIRLGLSLAQLVTK